MRDWTRRSIEEICKNAGGGFNESSADAWFITVCRNFNMRFLDEPRVKEARWLGRNDPDFIDDGDPTHDFMLSLRWKDPDNFPSISPIPVTWRETLIVINYDHAPRNKYDGLIIGTEDTTKDQYVISAFTWYHTAVAGETINSVYVGIFPVDTAGCVRWTWTRDLLRSPVIPTIQEQSIFKEGSFDDYVTTGFSIGTYYGSSQALTPQSGSEYVKTYDYRNEEAKFWNGGSVGGYNTKGNAIAPAYRYYKNGAAQSFSPFILSGNNITNAGSGVIIIPIVGIDEVRNNFAHSTDDYNKLKVTATGNGSLCAGYAYYQSKNPDEVDNEINAYFYWGPEVSTDSTETEFEFGFDSERAHAIVLGCYGGISISEMKLEREA